MKSRFPLSRRAVLLLPVAASLLAAGCASTPSPTYTHPAWGTALVYRVTNTGSFGSGTSDVTLRIEQATFEGRPVMRVVSPAGATLNEVATAATIAVTDLGGRVLMRYDPPLMQPWPLAVGKTATQRMELVRAPLR